MKTLNRFVLTGAAMLMFVPMVVHGAGNSVPNGDFETITASSTPQGWTSNVWGTMTANFTYPAPGFNSTRAARVDVTSYSSGDAKWYYGDLPVTPGVAYQISDNYQSNVATEIDAEFLLSNGTYSYAWIADVPSSNGAWASFSGTVTPPAGTVSMSITHLIFSVGNLTIDNMSVSSGTTPVAPTCTLSANPTSIQTGGASTLTFSSTNATTGSINQGIGSVGVSGTKSVSPTSTTLYTGTFAGAGGTTTCSANVTVTAAAKPAISSFTATPANITSGQSSTLAWSVTGATTLSINQGVGTVTGTSKVVSPTATTTYTLTATNATGTTTASVTLSVVPQVVVPPTPAPKPTISSFTANPVSITSGQSSTLSWVIANASSTSINNGVGVVTGTSKVVSPTATTTYIITATNPQGSATSSVTVKVTPVVVTPPATTTTNLITNGNFEAGTTNTPTGWTHDFWGNANPTFTYPITGNGGGKAAQIAITRTGTINGAANWIFTQVKTDGHTQYQFTEDYLSNVATELDVEYLMSDGTYKYEWLQTVPPSTSWKTITAQVTPPTGAVSFDVLHILAKKGTLAIDNATLKVLSDPFPQGMVSLTFDDGLLSQYTNALPIIKAAGLPAGFYIITSEPSSGDTGYMNWTQIKALNTQGYEVGAHTRTHPFLTQLTAAQQTSEINGSYSDLVAQGITPKSFIYPYGDESPAVESLVKAAGFNVARSSYTGQNGTVSNRYALYDVRVDTTTSLATIQALINQAKADKRWLVLEFHDVKTGGDVDSVTPAYFQSLITFIKNSGIQVANLQQAQQYLTN